MNKTAYTKSYKLRCSTTKFNSQNNKYFEVTFPHEVVEREARKRNITITELLSSTMLIAQYNGFDGVLYTFSEK